MLTETNLIYTIYNLKNLTKTYIGKTTQTLLQRWQQHISKARAPQNKKESKRLNYTTQ